MNAPANLPYWPRMLTRAMAAAYCGLTKPEFECAMADGVVPFPVKVAGKDLWSRVQMDEYLERLTGERLPDWRKNAPVYQGAGR